MLPRAEALRPRTRAVGVHSFGRLAKSWISYIGMSKIKF